MKKRFLLLSVVLLGVSPSMAATSQKSATPGPGVQCVAVDKAQIAALFDRWNNSLLTGDPAQVAANYAPDAVLLPTLSSKVRLTTEERIEYFKGFLRKGPAGRIDGRSIRVGCNKAVDTGTYTFTFSDGNRVPARYTFTYAWNGEKWLITSHHSSLIPE